MATGFGFTEGPVADGQGGIWFTDLAPIGANTRLRRSNILRFEIATGITQVVEENAGGANGLLLDSDGGLIAAEGYLQRVTRRAGGTRTVLVDEWDGLPFNGPNDLVMDAGGGIYFTDPNYFFSVQEEGGLLPQS